MYSQRDASRGAECAVAGDRAGRACDRGRRVSQVRSVSAGREQQRRRLRRRVLLGRRRSRKRNDTRPRAACGWLPISIELLRVAAGVRQANCTAASPARHRQRSRSTSVRRSARALPRPLGFGRPRGGSGARGRSSSGATRRRAVLAVREPQRAADQHDHVGPGRLELASVRGAADQPAGRHEPVRPGRAAADVER